MKETKWIDAWIRWPRAEDYDSNEEDDEEDEEQQKTSNESRETFSLSFPIEDSTINVELRGYQFESEQIWNSTGLTLWRSANHLCEYLVEQHSSDWFSNSRRILEVRRNEAISQSK